MMQINALQINIILLLGLISLSFSSEAQDFDYFENNPEWRELLITDWGYQYKNYVYYLNGDSIIGDYTYHQVYQRGQSTFLDFYANPSTTVGPPFDNYYGLLRQDGKKIYFIRFYWDADEEELLYNFNLSIGDTLPETYNQSNWPQEQVFIEDIDSININGNFHKRFMLSEVNQELFADTLIEGIGHKYGFLSSLYPINESSVPYPYLRCYQQEEEVVYKFGEIEDCGFDVSIEAHIKSSDIMFYPNPTSKVLHIKTPSHPYKYIRIVNFDGKEVYRNIEDIEEIDVSGFSPGVYCVQVILEDDSFVTSKLIVTN